MRNRNLINMIELSAKKSLNILCKVTDLNKIVLLCKVK